MSSESPYYECELARFVKHGICHELDEITFEDFVDLKDLYRVCSDWLGNLAGGGGVLRLHIIYKVFDLDSSSPVGLIELASRVAHFYVKYDAEREIPRVSVLKGV